jgi:hypothetical protein
MALIARDPHEEGIIDVGQDRPAGPDHGRDRIRRLEVDGVVLDGRCRLLVDARCGRDEAHRPVG